MLTNTLNDIFQTLKEHNCQLRLLHPTNHIEIDGEISILRQVQAKEIYGIQTSTTENNEGMPCIERKVDNSIHKYQTIDFMKVID